MSGHAVALPPPPREVPGLEADPASIRGCAGDLLAAATQVDSLGAFVAGDARIEEWQGIAATAYHAAIRPTGRSADALSLALRAVARRVDEHATAVQQLLARRARLVDEREHLLGRLRTLEALVGAATAEQVGALREESARCARAVRDFGADLDGWQRETLDEEDRMRAGFGRLLTPEQVEQRFGARADPADAALAGAPGAGAGPLRVSAWWAALDRRQQLAVIAAAPGAVGNRDGLPAWARDAANRIALDRDLAAWGALEAGGLLSGAEKRWLENARATRDARAVLADGLDPVSAAPVTSQLYLYDPTAFAGDGALALAVGDLTRADDVAVLVPGLGTDATAAVTQAGDLLRLHEAARTLDHRRTNASMLWIGYDAPDNLPLTGDGWDAFGVLGESLATRGGERLADAVEGLRAADDAGRAHLTVIGYSYGSTTLGHGAHDVGLPADDVVVVGSPGLGGDVDHASDLGLRAEHVWAGANSRDPVAHLGNHGAVHLELLAGAGLGDDPAEDDFGARRFRAESTTRAPRDGPSAWGDHTKYFDHDTESLFDIGQVVSGHYDAVLRADPVTDPWFAGPQDPESDRSPGSPVTVDPVTRKRP